MQRIFIVLFLAMTSLASFAGEVQILRGGREALKVRLELIQNAQKEIIISYFIFSDDETSHVFMSELRSAARRGVKVLVLVDSLFCDVKKGMLTHLLNEGVEFRFYNRPKLTNFWNMTRRMHDKIFMIDADTVIMGGRNIENTYFDQSNTKKNYLDRDILIKGNKLNELREYFFELWESDHVYPAKTLKQKEQTEMVKVEGARNLLDKSSAAGLFEGEDFLPLDPVNEVDDSLITLTHDIVALRKPKVSGTAEAIFNLIDSARESILIDSPYFILTKESRAHFAAAISRGVSIRVITNSAKATDGLLPLSGYVGQRKKIVQMGIEVYEYFGDYSFHAKSMVIDGKIAMVGSFNFDPRSQKLNTETAAIVHDAKVAAQLKEEMNVVLKECYRLGPDGHPEGQVRKYPGVSLKKIILTKIFQIFFVPFAKKQLAPASTSMQP